MTMFIRRTEVMSQKKILVNINLRNGFSLQTLNQGKSN